MIEVVVCVVCILLTYPTTYLEEGNGHRRLGHTRMNALKCIMN